MWIEIKDVLIDLDYVSHIELDFMNGILYIIIHFKNKECQEIGYLNEDERDLDLKELKRNIWDINLMRKTNDR